MDTVIRAQIDEEVTEDATAVLAAMGLTLSDAFSLMIVRIATERRLPFEALVPNEKTIAAMEAARCGDLAEFQDVKGLMADLSAEDQAYR